MEALGCIASIVTLPEAALRSCEKTKRLTRSLRSGTWERQALANKIELIFHSLNHIQKLLRLGQKAIKLSDEALKVTEGAISGTRRALADLQKAVPYHQEKLRFAESLKWAFISQDQAQVFLAKLRDAETDLLLCLQMLNMDIAISQKCATRSCVKPCPEESTQALTMHAGITDPASCKAPVSRSHMGGALQSSDQLVPNPTLSFENWFAAWGLNQLSLSISQHTDARYMGAKLVLILPLLRRKIAILFEIVIQRPRMTWTNFHLHEGNLVARTVIPEQHPAVHAIKSKDVVALQGLLKARAVFPNSMTPDGLTLLAYAIESGDLNVVRRLITEGADIRSSFQDHSVSPLQWAISKNQEQVARLLLSQGADMDHVDAAGWTTLFYLWPRRNDDFLCGPSRVHLIEMLLARDYHDLNSRDELGQTALHRAAIFGSGDDVRTLVRFGAESVCSSQERWTPLHFATGRNNPDTIEALVQDPCLADDINKQDWRGWTPLHLAAMHRCIETSRLLLQSGADPSLKSFATSYMVHPPQRNLAFTPAEGARLMSEESYSAFQTVLREVFPDGHIDAEDPSLKSLATSYMVHPSQEDLAFTPAEGARFMSEESKSAFQTILHEVFPDGHVDAEGELFCHADN
ncbi:MAG: hypothetical protein M1831_001661 [Alyxoria varia]|nr:MAG: hypothetical protein M1831_001661 [Alyxoria varia]